MRYIRIIILLVLCLTLLLLTSCGEKAVINETTSVNLENQENTEEPVIEEPAEATGTANPQKWSGLGMVVFNTENTSEFDSDVDILLANGFTELRMTSGWHAWDTETKLLSAVISVTTKGARVIWGVESGGGTLTSSNWDDYANAVLDAAQWAQDNGVFEFQLGNEEEMHNDDTTLTDAQLRTNLKSLATEVKEIFTRGNISYSCSGNPVHIDSWIAVDKGDIDILAANIYHGGNGEYGDWYKADVTKLVNAFGTEGTYLTEFAPSYTSLDDYSTNEAVQAVAITEMINYIKASGMTRAFFFCYRDPSWLSGFGVVKADGTYRQLWSQALLNSGSVESTNVPRKTNTASLPGTIALIQK